MRALMLTNRSDRSPAVRKASGSANSRVSRPVLPLLRRSSCACGGSCPRCKALPVSKPGDPYEREADAVAEEVMRAANGELSVRPAMSGVQRKGAAVQSAGSSAPASVAEVLNSPGQPLSAATRAFFEPRFGQDFSGIRVHCDAAAARSARDVGAKAYAAGHDIVFGAGQFAPETHDGRRLLAHELTHVVQQSGSLHHAVQRDCSDPDFCTPYATTEEAESAEWWIRNTYMRAEGVETFGTEVKGLYESFLSRSPGDSLAPVVFDSDSSYLVSSFRDSGDTTDDMDDVIDLVGDRLSRAPGPPLRDGVPRTMSLSNFLSASEMNNRPINYSNPFSVAGHIAGGIGSSDAGDDYRKITRANVTLEKTTLFGSTGYVTVELIPHYEVFDAIDFCPGDCGSPAEQIITVPMSRLEASGAAYDVPFKVIFSPEPRSKRFWF